MHHKWAYRISVDLRPCGRRAPFCGKPSFRKLALNVANPPSVARIDRLLNRAVALSPDLARAMRHHDPRES
jgi:hypothetical protein